MRAALSACACALALALVAPAQAAKSPWYTYAKGTGCSRQVDPVNVIFFGRDATAARTDAFVGRYMGWGVTDSSTQGFVTPRCRLARHQRADGDGNDSRNHVRLRQRDRRRGQRRRFTMGDAHHEDFTGRGPFGGCGLGGGHAVDKGSVKERTPEGSGFDQGRRLMANRWAQRGRYVKYVYKGNTRAFQQCDGDKAGSDGWVAYMSIPRRRR